MKTTIKTALACLAAAALASCGEKPGKLRETASDRQSAIQDAANLITKP